MYDLPWTFLSLDYYRWLHHSWKSLVNRFICDQKSLLAVIHALFYMWYIFRARCSWVWFGYGYRHRHCLNDGLVNRRLCAFNELTKDRRYWSFVWGIHWSPVNSPHKSQWRGALMFSLICAWINGSANNREPGDLRRHRCHYDVTVMH